MAKTMWDASTPPASVPGGPWDAAAGYIGGDTPHIWTVAEWRHLGGLAKTLEHQRLHDFPRRPCWCS